MYRQVLLNPETVSNDMSSSPPSYQEAAGYAIGRGQLVNKIKEDVNNIKGDVKNIEGDTTVLRSQVASLQGEVSQLRSDLGDIKAFLEYNLQHTTSSYYYKDVGGVKAYHVDQAARHERKARDKAEWDARWANARAARIKAREEASAQRALERELKDSKKAAERELKDLNKKMKQQQL